MRLPRRLALAVALAVLGTVLAGTSSAAGEGITIKGATSSWVDVTIYESGSIPESEIRISSRGRFAGFFLMPDTSTRPPVGALAVPHVGAGVNGSRLLPLGETYRVYAGRYRLYLLAEAPTEVFIPIAGQAYRAYAPRRRAAVSFRPFTFGVTANAPGAQKRLTYAPRRRTVLAAAELVTSSALTGVDYVAACVTPAYGPCRASTLGWRAPGTSARSSSTAVQMPGRYDLVYDVTRGPGLHGDSRANAIAFTLTLA